jgi:hypothetical protein
LESDLKIKIILFKPGIVPEKAFKKLNVSLLFVFYAGIDDS